MKKGAEQRVSQFIDAMGKASDASTLSPEATRQLLVTGVPIFTAMSVAGLVGASVLWGVRASWIAWSCGVVAGVVLALLCIADVRMNYQFSALPSKLPAWIRVPLAAATLVAPFAVAVVLWWMGSVTIVANLAVAVTTALALSGATTWVWLSRHGLMDRAAQ